MRDLFFIGFMFALIVAGCVRPWLMTLGYMYVDLVQPHQVTYYLLSQVPTSAIMAGFAVAFFVLFEDKRALRLGAIQWLLALLILWTTLTTMMSLLPQHAWVKWDSAWKSIGFGIFLPFIITTRQRLEAALLIFILCIGTLTITGGIKTVLGGGGYGTLRLLVTNNTGLYESSTISAVAVSLIPLILYLWRHMTLVPRTWLTKLAMTALIVSSLLIPVGTEARTGLICVAVLAAMLWWQSRRKLVLAGATFLITTFSWPLLPHSFTDRMATIVAPDEESSASTRVEVWKWTWAFAKDHPLGGGFGVYRLNKIKVEVKKREGDEQSSSEETITVTQRGRAFHSAYFEVLGEHGYPGIVIYLAIFGLALLQLRSVYRRFKNAAPDDLWIRDLARALGRVIVLLAIGQIFVGIAFQTVTYTVMGFAAALMAYVARRQTAAAAERTQPKLQFGSRRTATI